MISQTDALTKATEASGDSIDWMVNEQVVPLRDVHMLIRSIYESVGTCKQCEYDENCDIQGMYGMENEWYCADFRRKQNDK